jgi:biopolymer transport protein ExbD
MAGTGGSSEGEPEFQVAPMVDVLLTILVFFMMITSAQVLKVDKTITLPVAPDALKRDNQRNEVIINVRWLPETKKAEFVIDDHVYATAGDISAALRSAKVIAGKKIAKSGNQAVRAVIRGDQNLPALYVSQVMDQCGETGIGDISFSTLNK